MVGSIVVSVRYLVVLRYWAASRAAYAFVLTPFITVVLSAWLDDEPIHAGLILGACWSWRACTPGRHVQPNHRPPAGPALI